MKANNYISRKKYKLLLITAFLTSVIAFSNFTFQVIEKYNNSVSEQQAELRKQANDEPIFGIYSFERASSIPFLNFLSFFIFITLYKSKRFIASSILTLLIFMPFAYEFYLGFRFILFYNPFPKHSFTELLFLFANRFDYLVFLLVSILLFWQISILLRMLIKTLQRKTELP